MQTLDYRSFLEAALRQRQLRNPDYSLRAFARDLEVSPQKLSQVLTGRSGLSGIAARDLAEKINLRRPDRDLFIALVESQHSRSPKVRESALVTIERLKSTVGFKQAQPEQSSLWSHWSILAIYVLSEVSDFEPTISWIATRLGITEDRAQLSCDQLFAKGVLRKDENDKWVRDAEKLYISSDEPSQTLRDYYRQLWEIADHTLDQESMPNREFAASLLAVNLEDIDDVRQELDAFRKNLMTRLDARQSSTKRVYALSFQFFPVDRTSF